MLKNVSSLKRERKTEWIQQQKFRTREKEEKNFPLKSICNIPQRLRKLDFKEKYRTFLLVWSPYLTKPGGTASFKFYFHLRYSQFN